MIVLICAREVQMYCWLENVRHKESRRAYDRAAPRDR